MFLKSRFVFVVFFTDCGVNVDTVKKDDESWQSDIDHLSWLDIAGLNCFNGKGILDLGCGSGYICHKAMQDGATHAVGIDIVSPAKSYQDSFDFRSLNLDDANWHQSVDEKFDLILAFDILEHLASPYWLLQSSRQLLSKNGVLVVTTPNTLSWERFVKPETWSGVTDPQHKTLFSKYSLKFLLSKVGFQKIALSAPMRSLKKLGPLQPQCGGQILAVASL